MTATILEVSKTQNVRRVDMYLLGPFMMWYAWESRGMNDLARLLLGAAGFLTITYNATRFQEQEKIIEDATLEPPRPLSSPEVVQEKIPSLRVYRRPRRSRENRRRLFYKF